MVKMVVMVLMVTMVALVIRITNVIVVKVVIMVAMDMVVIVMIFTEVMVLIIITRPKPAYGRQGLAGSWGQDTYEVSTFLVFLTSHFAPTALSSDLNQPEK